MNKAIKEPYNYCPPPQSKKPIIFICSVPLQPFKYKSFNKEIKRQEYKKTKNPEEEEFYFIHDNIFLKSNLYFSFFMISIRYILILAYVNNIVGE